MKTYKRICIAASLWMIGGVASVVWAQSGNGIIFGTVTDQSGAVVSTAAITATNIATGIWNHAKPDKSANYVTPALPAATYSIRCESTGFQTIERTGILL